MKLRSSHLQLNKIWIIEKYNQNYLSACKPEPERKCVCVCARACVCVCVCVCVCMCVSCQEAILPCSVCILCVCRHTPCRVCFSRRLLSAWALQESVRLANTQTSPSQRAQWHTDKELLPMQVWDQLKTTRDSFNQINLYSHAVWFLLVENIIFCLY